MLPWEYCSRNPSKFIEHSLITCRIPVSIFLQSTVLFIQMAYRPASPFYLGQLDFPSMAKQKQRGDSLHLARSSTTSIPQTKITYSFVYPVHIKTNVASSIFSEQRGKKNQIPLKICGIKQKYVPPILGFYKSFVKDKITLVYSSKNILSIVHPLDRYQ